MQYLFFACFYVLVLQHCMLKMCISLMLILRSLTGQTILHKQLQNSSNTRLELEGASGVYFFSIQTEEGTAVLKIIKN